MVDLERSVPFLERRVIVESVTNSMDLILLQVKGLVSLKQATVNIFILCLCDTLGIWIHAL